MRIGKLLLSQQGQQVMKHTAFFVSLILISVGSVRGQGNKEVPNGTDGLVLEVRDSANLDVKKLPPTEFEGSKASFKIGAGLIYDFTTYSQDDVFKAQMDSGGFNLEPKIKLRDFRVLGSGVFKTKRPISFKFAYMWDGANEAWLVRETGLTIAVPELAGHIFIGRTKEGYSMPKVMNGHSPWTNERQMAVEPIPILADGIKWLGFLPKSRIFWNLGAFADWLSKGQGFSTYEWQFTGRIGWMPIYDPQNRKLIHIATNLRYGKPLNETFTVKARPESNNTPFLISTGAFATDRSTHTGAEVYYSNKRLMLGSEVMVHRYHTPESGYHNFYGGDAVISYFFTNTYRPYKTQGSIYGFVPVRRSVFHGGIGEFEGVLRMSTFNLNDGAIKGGQFWRVTPMINWYMTKVIRFEAIYGYGVLDRYALKGHVHFFETRIQFTIL
jgi:phosphate-selective porin OprO/OprP